MDCPSRQQIFDYLLGKLPEVQFDGIAAHLDSCKICERIAAELDARTKPVVGRLVAAEANRSDDRSRFERDLLRDALDKAKRVARQDTAIADIDDTDCDADEEAQLQKLLATLAPPQAADELARLGDFRIIEVLGVGGMGVVFRGEDLQLKRSVALKVLKPAVAAIPAAVDRFLHEARAAAAIEDDHVIAIHQIGEDRGVQFLAMPLLEGVSLRQRLTTVKRLPLAETLRIGREIAEGLDAAHQQGLLHRDVKPDNIWLEGERGRVKILDYGLARFVEAGADLTAADQIVGTPRYMSPEQALGQQLDQRSDLFSLGCVLYRMASGKRPFSAASATATLVAVVHEPPVPIAQHAPELPPSCCKLVHRLLAKQPDDRYRSAREVVAAIQAIESELQPADVAPEATVTHQPLESSRRTRNWSLIALAIPLLIVLGVVISIETDNGTLRIKAKDETVAVRIRGQQVMIRDRDSGEDLTVTIGERVRLGSGRYELAVSSTSGLKFDADKFEITRGQEQVLLVEVQPQRSDDDKIVPPQDEVTAPSPPRPLVGQWTPKDGWLPLIPLLGPMAEDMQGAFRIVDGTLISGGTRTLILLPLDIDGEYDLEATIPSWTIKSNHHVDFYLPIGNDKSLFFRMGIDATNTGTGCCFRTSTARVPYVDLPFSAGDRVQLTLQIRRTNDVVTTVAVINGQQVTSCRRPLDGSPAENDVSQLSLLELMPGRSYSDLRMRMVSGRAGIRAHSASATTP